MAEEPHITSPSSSQFRDPSGANIIVFPSFLRRQMPDDALAAAVARDEAMTLNVRHHIKLARQLCQSTQEEIVQVIDGQTIGEAEDALFTFNQMRAALSEAYATVGIASNRLGRVVAALQQATQAI